MPKLLHVVSSNLGCEPRGPESALRCYTVTLCSSASPAPRKWPLQNKMKQKTQQTNRQKTPKDPGPVSRPLLPSSFHHRLLIPQIPETLDIRVTPEAAPKTSTGGLVTYLRRGRGMVHREMGNETGKRNRGHSMSSQARDRMGDRGWLPRSQP